MMGTNKGMERNTAFHSVSYGFYAIFFPRVSISNFFLIILIYGGLGFLGRVLFWVFGVWVFS